MGEYRNTEGVRILRAAHLEVDGYPNRGTVRCAVPGQQSPGCCKVMTQSRALAVSWTVTRARPPRQYGVTTSYIQRASKWLRRERGKCVRPSLQG